MRLVKPCPIRWTDGTPSSVAGVHLVFGMGTSELPEKGLSNTWAFRWLASQSLWDLWPQSSAISCLEGLSQVLGASRVVSQVQVVTGRPLGGPGLVCPSGVVFGVGGFNSDRARRLVSIGSRTRFSKPGQDGEDVTDSDDLRHRPSLQCTRPKQPNSPRAIKTSLTPITPLSSKSPGTLWRECAGPIVICGIGVVVLGFGVGAARDLIHIAHPILICVRHAVASAYAQASSCRQEPSSRLASAS